MRKAKALEVALPVRQLPLGLALRFPALVQNSVVVLVWWLVLVPFITKLKPPAERGGFLRFNLSFDLVNIHFLNLPAAGLDYLAAPRPPHLVDGWVVAALLFSRARARAQAGSIF